MSHQRVRAPVLLLVLGALGAGCAVAGPSADTPPSPVVATIPPDSTITPAPTPTATLRSPSHTPAASAIAAEPTEFMLPTPACPSPTEPVAVPSVTVSVGDAPGIVATKGSSTIATCSTTGVVDAIPTDPVDGLQAKPGDLLRLALPSGWRLLRWQGYDRPVAGEGANVWPPVDTPERPDRDRPPSADPIG